MEAINGRQMRCASPAAHGDRLDLRAEFSDRFAPGLPVQSRQLEGTHRTRQIAAHKPLTRKAKSARSSHGHFPIRLDLPRRWQFVRKSLCRQGRGNLRFLLIPTALHGSSRARHIQISLLALLGNPRCRSTRPARLLRAASKPKHQSKGRGRPF